MNRELLSVLSGKELATYMALDSFRNYKTNSCNPSIAKVAGILKWCVNTTRKYIYRLKEKGLLKIEYRKKSDSVENDTNVYTFIQKVDYSKLKGTPRTGQKQKHLRKSECMNATEIKKKLLQKFDESVVNKALHKLSKAKHDIINTYNWLVRVCESIKVQVDLVNMKTPTKPTQGVKRTYANPTVKRTGFYFSEQRSQRYTPEELERILLENQKKKFG